MATAAGGAGNDSEKVYAFFGHGSEPLEDITKKGKVFPKEIHLPEGFVLVLTEECGIEGTLPKHVFEAMANPTNLPFFQDPVRHADTVRSLLRKNLQIFVGPTVVPNLSFTLFNNDKFEKKQHLFISGVHELPLQKVNINGKLFEPNHFETLKKFQVMYSNIVPFFEHASFPRLEDIVDENSNDESGEEEDSNENTGSNNTENIKRLNVQDLKQKLKFRLSDILEKVGKGVYYSTLCRSVSFINSETHVGLENYWNAPSQIVRTLMPSKNILSENNAALFQKAKAVLESRKNKSKYVNARTITRRNASLLNVLSTKCLDENVKVYKSARNAIDKMPLEKIDHLESTHTGDHLAHLAARRDDVVLLEKLKERGANFHVLNFYFETPLHTACASRSVGAALFLLEPEIVGLQNATGNTILMEVCDNNLSEIAAVLLTDSIFEPYLRVRAHDGEGDTALHLACGEDAVLCCDLLIKHDPSLVQVENFRKKTPWMRAVDSHSIGCMELIAATMPELVKYDDAFRSFLTTEKSEDFLLRGIEALLHTGVVPTNDNLNFAINILQSNTIAIRLFDAMRGKVAFTPIHYKNKMAMKEFRTHLKTVKKAAAAAKERRTRRLSMSRQRSKTRKN